ncbi:MAG: response regulator transcription factor [Armatimonadaceae bacterium]
MSEAISVLLVDDHVIVRQGIRALLETRQDILVVGEAGSGREAVKMATELAPDVVLMDLLMPEMNGVEATRGVKEFSPRTQVVIGTSYHDDEHILPAIKAGALCYLLKDIGPEELITTIHRAARGEAFLHPRIASQVMQALHGKGRGQETLADSLSAREVEVLRLIAEGLNNQEIADKLVISEKTVKSHVSNILGKLHLADRTQAAVFAWREGLMRS